MSSVRADPAEPPVDESQLGAPSHAESTRLVSRASRQLARAELTLVVLMLILLVAAGLVQVFSRYVLNASMTWTEELARTLFIWSTFLGASAAITFRREIKVDVLDVALRRLDRRHPALSRRLRLGADVMAPTVSAAFVAVLAYLAYDFVAFQAASGSSSVELSVPNWILTLVLPVALGFSALHYLAVVVDAIDTSRAPRDAQMHA